MTTKVSSNDPVRPASGTGTATQAQPAGGVAAEGATIQTVYKPQPAAAIAQDQQLKPNERAAATNIALPAAAPAQQAQPVAAYGDTFGGQSYVKDGKNAELLSLAKRAAAMDPALANGSFGQSLQNGSLSPDDIKTLQTSLKSKGFDVGHQGVDGKFGPNTHAALAKMLTGQQPDQAATPATPADGTNQTTPVTPGQTPTTPGQTDNAALERLRNMSAAELAHLGKTDKKAFFEALRPAAEEAERRYGVPAAVTLAQAGLESGYGTRTPGGNSFNFFGIKRNGPAGQVQGYARYHNALESVMEHGKLFHNGYYGKALDVVRRGGNSEQFLKSIEGVYHQTGPRYTRDSMAIIRKYGLER